MGNNQEKKKEKDHSQKIRTGERGAGIDQEEAWG